MTANLKMLITIIVISLFVSNSYQRKFSNKQKNNNQNHDKSVSPSTSITSGTSQTATTSVNSQSKQSQKPTQTKQTTNTQTKKQQKDKDNVKSTQKSDNSNSNKKQSDQKVKVQQKQKVQQKNYIVQYKIQAKDNQYVIPIKIGNQQYNLGIGYDQEDSQYGNIGSWIFTNLTQQHSLCDAQDDCQDIQNIVKCFPNNTKQKQPNCIDKGKSKLSNDIIQSKKKVNVTFTNNNNNNNNTLSSIFISPSKISLKNNQIAQNQIQGFINLAFNNNKQKYQNSISVSGNKIQILQQKQLQNKLNKQNVIDLSKTGLLTLGDKKDIYIRTQDKDKTIKKQTNNIQLNYHKIKISFNKIEKTLAMPKNMITTIKNILKKQYFGDRCKIKDIDVNCSAAPIKKIEQIKLCRDKNGKNCIQLPILGGVIKQVISQKSYKLLIEENKNQQGNTTIIFYPYFSKFYQVYASKGLVKGVLLLNNSVQKVQKKQEKEEKKQSQQDKKQQKQEKTQTKQVAKNKGQQKSQKQGKQKDKKQQKEQKVGQVQKNDKQQKTKDQSQSQKEATDDYQNEDDDNQDSDTEQQEQKKDTKSSSSSNKQNKQKASSNHKQSITSPTDKSVQKGKIEQQKTYSKGILFFVFIYGSIFIGIIIVIKWKAQQSFAAAAIDRFLQVTWYSIGKNYFNKNRGYNAAFEDDQKGQQQIDHSDSIAVGYTQNKGKQLFWQNNSVQGI